jgi:hypothetical protein
MGIKWLRNAHCICHRDRCHICCVPPVRRIKHSTYETYAKRWYWSWQMSISTASFCWPPKHTPNMVFQYSVSRTFWSQHNRQPPHSITRGTNNQIQHSHERPALPLLQIRWISCFSSDMGLSPTQISSIYDTIVSEFVAPAMTLTYLLSECYYWRYHNKNVSHFQTMSCSPQSYTTTTTAATTERKSRLDWDITKRTTNPTNS